MSTFIFQKHSEKFCYPNCVYPVCTVQPTRKFLPLHVTFQELIWRLYMVYMELKTVWFATLIDSPSSVITYSYLYDLINFDECGWLVYEVVQQKTEFGDPGSGSNPRELDPRQLWAEKHHQLMMMSFYNHHNHHVHICTMQQNKIHILFINNPFRPLLVNCSFSYTGEMKFYYVADT